MHASNMLRKAAAAAMRTRCREACVRRCGRGRRHCLAWVARVSKPSEGGGARMAIMACRQQPACLPSHHVQRCHASHALTK